MNTFLQFCATLLAALVIALFVIMGMRAASAFEAEFVPGHVSVIAGEPFAVGMKLTKHADDALISSTWWDDAADAGEALPEHTMAICFAESVEVLFCWRARIKTQAIGLPQKAGESITYKDLFMFEPQSLPPGFENIHPIYESPSGIYNQWINFNPEHFSPEYALLAITIVDEFEKPVCNTKLHWHQDHAHDVDRLKIIHETTAERHKHKRLCRAE
jgi:hypothetical protein